MDEWQKAYKGEKTMKKNEPLKAKPMTTSPFDIKGWWMLRKASKYPERKILITMMLNTGRRISFWIIEKKDHFIFNGGRYMIDQSAMYEDASNNTKALDYHEGISIPIRPPEYSELKKKNFDVKALLDPSVLETTSTSNVIKNIVQGTEDESLKKMTFMIMIILVCVILMLLMLFRASGGLGGILG